MKKKNGFLECNIYSVLFPEERIKCVDTLLWLRIGGCGSSDVEELKRVADLKGLRGDQEPPGLEGEGGSGVSSLPGAFIFR